MSKSFRIETVEEFLAGALSAREAKTRLGVHRVTFWRQVKRYERLGRQGLEHGLKGRPSNRTLPRPFQREVLDLYLRECAAFGVSVLSFYRKHRESFARKVSYSTVLAWIREYRKNSVVSEVQDVENRPLFAR